jgi:hypothetical protein
VVGDKERGDLNVLKNWSEESTKYAAKFCSHRRTFHQKLAHVLLLFIIIRNGWDACNQLINFGLGEHCKYNAVLFASDGCKLELLAGETGAVHTFGKHLNCHLKSRLNIKTSDPSRIVNLVTFRKSEK